MFDRSRSTRYGWLALVGLIALASIAIVPPGAAADPECSVDLEQPADVPDCAEVGDALTVTIDGEVQGGVEVPPEGRGIFVHAMEHDGTTLDFMVETLENGEVVVDGDGLLPPGGCCGSGPPACSDGAFNLIKADNGNTVKWKSTMNWYYKTGSRPDYLSEADVIEEIRDGATNITHANNNCGQSDQVSAASDYQGGTNNSVNMPNGTNNCAGFDDRDGVSVASFGATAGNFLAWACTWWVGDSGPDRIVESDIRYDKSGTSWVTSGPCTASYRLEAVATHEFGHSFGLDHVVEDGHENLTMSRNLNGTCQNSEASLGLGDVFGLEDLY